MTSSTLRITGVDFIAIPTRDFVPAVEFYAGVLGLEKSKQWGNMPGQEFETGNLTLAIMQSDAFGIPFSTGAPIALRVDDVAAAREELEAAGIAFEADNIDSGVCHMAYFKDPDGNILMLHHRYAPPTLK